MSIQSNEILFKVQEQLNLYLKELHCIKLIPFQSMTLNSSDFNNEQSLKYLISQIKKNNSPIIYTLSCFDSAKLKGIMECYFQYQIHNSTLKRGIDRLNISRYNHSDSETLYIGSSMNDLPKRIKQHLGGGNFRTYSLHLSKWTSNLQYEILFSSYRIKHKYEKQLDRSFVELIEQTLWELKKPVFGKKSGL